MQKISQLIISLFLFVVSVFSLAYAQTSPIELPAAQAKHVAQKPALPAVTTGSVAAQLEKLQTDLMLLKAETARANAQAEFDKISREVSKRGAVNNDLPLVKSIFGRNGALTATLRFRSGGIMDVKTGDQLPNGYKVIRIDTGVVTFTKQGRFYDVGLTATNDASLLDSLDLMVAPPLPLSH
ncbi:type IV pilus biogenesis protein PilP [Photorhabdus heterorhabditis]|uniref:type IV pilus biogenesis protein PilP n=1 Tax=Photorhabdus heterorhabditis TaxID=880156 RepID=UPI001561FE62|nr:type IV pilus biogenesis protein PilP [Photorhabdus heterorhabditis]NRN28680.1 type IV pilus biogenesis protein PilP [Photorhabdus heterorhabditis subsp. aluminescens]